MQKDKTYVNVRFTADALRAAYSKFIDQVKYGVDLGIDHYQEVEIGGETWHHDSIEEFFVDYRKSTESAVFQVQCSDESRRSFRIQVIIAGNTIQTLVSVSGPDRPTIEEVFDVFENYVDESMVAVPEVAIPENYTAPKVFIGHGRDPQWRDLKDHLQDLHDYTVVVYESGARTGHAVRDVLEGMLKESDFAILVMTGEDATKENQMNPRLNVVHELGLFQGRLGFARAIVLLEESAQEFSNINGVDQIRFSEGNIKETFGDVLATLRREFPAEIGFDDVS